MGSGGGPFVAPRSIDCGQLLELAMGLYFGEKQKSQFKHTKEWGMEIAQESQDLADELFAKHKADIQKTETIFDKADEIECYTRCDEETAAAMRGSAMRQVYGTVDRAMDSFNCYQVGAKRSVLRQASKGQLVASALARAKARKWEDDKQDVRESMKVGAKLGLATEPADYRGVTSGFNMVGQTYVELAQQDRRLLADQAVAVAGGLMTVFRQAERVERQGRTEPLDLMHGNPDFVDWDRAVIYDPGTSATTYSNFDNLNPST